MEMGPFRPAEKVPAFPRIRKEARPPRLGGPTPRLRGWPVRVIAPMIPGMTSSIIHVPRRYTREEWGGTETVIQELARHQQAAGEVPKVVTSMALANRSHEEIGGVPVERHPHFYSYFGLSAEQRLALDKKGGNLVSIGLFRALLREKNARIFHAHAINRLGGTVARAARLAGKPFVVSLHGGVYELPAEENEAMQRPIAGKFDWGRPLGALLGSRTLLERADFVICVGGNEADAARGHLPHDRIAHLPNGVDCERFAKGEGNAFRQKHGIAKTDFLVLNIARIDAQKNQLGLVEAFARFAADRPEARLVMIGPETQPDYARRLREAIAASGAADRIHLLPGLPPESQDLLDAYAACDVFALPSAHEPFGIAVLEAWSAGKPVVAAAVGGLNGLIKDGKTGLFCRGSEDLAGHLGRLCDSPAYCREIGRAGSEEARRSYNWSMIHRRLESIYEAATAHRLRKHHV